jgi:hypothetical protein
MQFIVSPWAEVFEHFSRSIQSKALLVAPFIAGEPLEHLASILDSSNPPEIELLTNFAVDSLLQGSTDAKVIASFCRMIPKTTVRHLPGLHAKAYVADDRLAIITSGNLTNASLHRNYEYGIQVSDSNLVRQISQDLRDYGNLGSDVSLAELDQLAEISGSLRARHAETLRTARVAIRKEFERQIEVAQEALRYLRAKPGESTSAIFSRTILYILRNGPLTTQQIHPIVEGIHPDLCDNTIDRVINGVHFGKRWKHAVRSAQQRLKARGLIKFAEGKWSLTQEN